MVPMSLDPSSFDRTDLVEYREEPDTLPNDIFFLRLHYLACQQNTIAVRDEQLGHNVSQAQLLSDIINCKKAMVQRLDPRTLQKLRADEEVPFVILARSYQFVVAYFAILAIGGTPVPASPLITTEEIRHIVKTCRAHGALYSPQYEKLAATLTGDSTVVKEYKHIAIDTRSSEEPIDPRTVRFFTGKIRDPNKPAVIIFTSGSTGKPKGAALRRGGLLAMALMQTWKNGIQSGFAILQMLPTHHATGLLLNTIPTLVGGGCVEFTSSKFDAALIWNRILQGGIQSISGVPTIYVRLLQHWEHVLQKLDDRKREEYRSAMCAVEQFHCGASALPSHISAKWCTVFPGTRIIERYGGTEFGNPYANDRGSRMVPGSVGVKNPGVESYLENGNEGEIFIRSPFMFSKYVYDVEGTKSSLTPEGFFKTGDIAEKIDDHYFIKGRKSVDILKSGGYKVSALDIEREMLEHPKIAEAAVMGIDDAEFGQRIAAAVVLKQGYTSLSLSELRNDLRSKLSTYKIPTILRVVPELKKTASLKVPKALIKNELFGTGHPDMQKWAPSQSKL